MTPCEMDSLRVRGWKINGKSAAVFSPDCRPDGSFVPEQCDKSKGQCWCVDKKGNELVGTRADGRRTCTSQGGYKIGLNTSSQSLFSVILVFFLAIASPKELKEYRQPFSLCWLPNLDSRVPSKVNISLYSHFFLAGETNCQKDGKPACDKDGAYAPRQCDNITCWCVDRLGREIPRTRTVDEKELLNCDVTGAFTYSSYR